MKKPVVVLMDGQACRGDDAKAALVGCERMKILDLLHATSKLGNVMHVFHPPGSEAELKAMRLYTLRLLHGGVDDLVRWFHYCAEDGDLRAAEQKRVETVCGYFDNHRVRMRYDQYLA